LRRHRPLALRIRDEGLADGVVRLVRRHGLLDVARAEDGDHAPSVSLCLSALVAPAISIRSLSVVRGGRDVLHEISLDVEPGSVTGLLGPRGSGKTTLIRSVVGAQIVAG